MNWRITRIVALWLGLAMARAWGQTPADPLVRQKWYETRTAHFLIYSCGPSPEVFKLAGHLEQFREAYASLAGAQAVKSPPIIVMAFPTHKAMEPFLPLYQGHPGNLAAFFLRNSDENLIVLSLEGQGGGGMEVIYHEYTHLLLRHNDRFWPLCLQEGMAEIYSTFEGTGHGVRIGKPIEHHLRLLNSGQYMPLQELFSVKHDSPQYNEREHQGVFYAESWLLAHYLMNGGNATRKAQFGQLTALLRQGQKPEVAFVNVFRASFATMDAELRGYLQRGQFESIGCVVATDLNASRAMATRPMGASEVCFRLGNELMRIDRKDEAGGYFGQAQKFAPSSPLGYEGLGLLASREKNHEEAVKQLKESIQHNSASFLAHYVYAQERLILTSNGAGQYHRVEKTLAGEIRSELDRSLGLMPDFGPASYLYGFLDLLQGEDYGAAEQHFIRAIQLEPENQSYLLSLAETQLRKNETESARRTLQALQLPQVDAKLREQAAEMLQEMGQAGGRNAKAR